MGGGGGGGGGGAGPGGAGGGGGGGPRARPAPRPPPAPPPPPPGGQATVEFVLLVPLFAVLLMLVLQAATVGAEAVVTVHAAREGAREAAVTADLKAVERAVRRSVADEPGTSTRTRVRVEGERRLGGYVRVTVERRLRPRIPLVERLLPGAIPVRAAVSMRVEVP